MLESAIVVILLFLIVPFSALEKKIPYFAVVVVLPSKILQFFTVMLSYPSELFIP